MSFEIFPHEGVGLVRFGMSRTEVRGAIGLQAKQFLRADKEDTDYFAEAGLFVSFAESGKAQAIELAAPSQAMLGDRDLLGMSFSEAMTFLLRRDPQSTVETDSLISKAEGVGIWAPLAKDNPEAPVEGVIVFAPGYYD